MPPKSFLTKEGDLSNPHAFVHETRVILVSEYLISYKKKGCYQTLMHAVTSTPAGDNNCIQDMSFALIFLTIRRDGLACPQHFLRKEGDLSSPHAFVHETRVILSSECSISYKKKGCCQTLMHAVHTQAHTHAEDKELHSTYELYPHPSISYEKTGCHDTLNQLLNSLRKEGDLSNPHA